MPQGTCSVSGCDRPTATRGWCHAHYLRWRRTGDVNASRPLGHKNDGTCCVSGCDRPRYGQQEICEAHYRRRRRTGSTDDERPVGWIEEPKPCMVNSCPNTCTERGLCHGHYLRLIRLGDVQADRPLSRQVNEGCKVEICNRQAVARGLCKTHANRKRKFGDVQADKPIRVTDGTGNINHGYRRIPVAPGERHLVDGDTSAFEHRLVMARMLGRPLTMSESVHHRNGDRLDNRPENLELWSRWQPSGQRVTDKVGFAIALLERYAPHLLRRGYRRRHWRCNNQLSIDYAE